jgi:hypothetical protein
MDSANGSGNSNSNADIISVRNSCHRVNWRTAALDAAT